MALANLVKQATSPVRVAVIDPHAEIGLGLAYSTIDISHLLNVRASRMGAWKDSPNDFWKWLEHSSYAKRYAADDFVPRMIYAEYLKHISQNMFLQAEQKSIEIIYYCHEAQQISNKGDAFHIALNNQHSLDATFVVLSSGNPLPQPERMIRGMESLEPSQQLASAWDVEALLKQAADLPKDATIFILGAGLTMVDSVLSLMNAGFHGDIIALSRSGHLPLPHSQTHSAAPPHLAIENMLQTLSSGAPTILRWLRILRNEAANMLHHGGDWREVIDGLRPHTLALWNTLPDSEKKRFFRHGFSVWNIHRHRMAPEVHERLDQLIASGKLRLLKGRLQNVERMKHGINIQWIPRGTSHPETLNADAVMLCAGPGYDFYKSGSALYRQLFHDKILKAHPSGYGVQHSTENPRLLLLGTPCIGEQLETTAVPELRQQAANAATRILDALKPH